MESKPANPLRIKKADDSINISKSSTSSTSSISSPRKPKTPRTPLSPRPQKRRSKSVKNVKDLLKDRRSSKKENKNTTIKTKIDRKGAANMLLRRFASHSMSASTGNVFDVAKNDEKESKPKTNS